MTVVKGPYFSVLYGGVLPFLHPQGGNSLIPAAGKCTLKSKYSIDNEPSCNPCQGVRHDPIKGERVNTLMGIPTSNRKAKQGGGGYSPPGIVRA